jgi:DNA-binding NarL/FixJ family response regulator
MRLLCIGRHPYISAHYRRFFESLGLEVVSTEDIPAALGLLPTVAPDVALVDYELLATRPMGEWLEDAVAREVPLVAVSLTRRPEEMLLDRTLLVGGLYLPAVSPATALAVLRQAASRGGVVLPPDAALPGRGARVVSPMPASAPHF